jgi:hypothetical protein
LTATTTDAQVDDMIRVVDSMFTQMTDAASNLGAVNKRISMQEDFVSNLMDAIDKWCRPIGRCGHERGIDAPESSADTAAAWYPVAFDRQLELAEHPVAVPLRDATARKTGSELTSTPGRNPRRFFVLRQSLSQTCGLVKPSVTMIRHFANQEMAGRCPAGMAVTGMMQVAAVAGNRVRYVPEFFCQKGHLNDKHYDQFGCNGCATDAAFDKLRHGNDSERECVFGLPCGKRWRQLGLLVHRNNHAIGQQGDVDRQGCPWPWRCKGRCRLHGMDSSIDVVSEIKAKLVAAREPGVDKTKIDKELTELKNQLKSISESASFSGENWLNNTSTAAARAQNRGWWFQP